jgi:hypothetical protein
MGCELVESGRQENFIFPKILTPPVENNQPVIHGMLGFSSRQVMRPGRKADKSRHLGQKLITGGATISLPIYAFVACKRKTLPSLFYSITLDATSIQNFVMFSMLKAEGLGVGGFLHVLSTSDYTSFVEK